MEQKVIQAATQWEYTKLLEEAIVDGYRVLSYDSVQHMPQNNGVFISVTMQKGQEQIIPVAVEKQEEKRDIGEELLEAVKNVKAASEEKPARQASARKPKQ